MHRAAGVKFAGPQAEGIDAERRGGEIAVEVEPVGDRPGGGFGAAGEGDVRLKCAQIEVESGGEERVVEALAELKEVRVAGADAGPEHARRSLRRKGAEPLDRQQKRRDAHGGQLLAQGADAVRVHIAEKAQRQVQLLRPRPGDAGQGCGERGEDGAHGRGQCAGDEEALGRHDGAAAPLRTS